ncbi:family 43 glycosylhydrolase [Thermopolyspora sp. NPDC052614]|uniref:family 43 glycosylhydrolase n=1 Tax=Thermopolyspora sp. NPDC052614 TaxID=3155682 RepID=UPI00343A6DF9
MKRALLTTLAACLLATPALTAHAAPRGASAPDISSTSGGAGRYTNPVSAGFADTFADPVIIRGRDGFWYAYGTSDPLREGSTESHRIPIAKSADLTRWTHVGDAFSGDGLPPYAAPGSMFWAPDVRYLDGRYVMYFAVTDTTVSAQGSDFGIGAATAPSPAGPWTPAPELVVPPRPRGDSYWWTIDPAQFTDVDGRKYLYFGSYFGGVWVTELSPDGLRAVGEPVMVAIDNKFEGGHVVRRDGYYYLFASSANCCAGPTTGYAVFVGRATSPKGPFLDRDGLRLDVSRAGGTPVVAPNGNRWIGTGHNGLLTDLSGQDWLVYHAIDRADPFLSEPYGINERPMLIDRLDWIDGWPTVRAGAWASDGPEPAPVTRAPVQDGFDDRDLRDAWRNPAGWRVTDGRLRGRGELIAKGSVPDERRVEADLRIPSGGHGAAGLRVADQATVRIAGNRLIAEAAGTRAEAALPSGFDARTWHNLAAEVRGRTLVARLSQARLGDELASVRLTAPRALGGATGVLGVGGEVEADNVSAARLYRPITGAVPVPEPGRLVFAEECGGPLRPGWGWVREDTAATVADGGLRWPVQGAELVGDANRASVLLRDAPSGDYLVETKVTLALGEDEVRNYQQAGLVAYVDDDDFARLSQVAIWNTRQVEYGRELRFADRLSYGGTIVGTPAATTWLRLAHRVDPATGEHEFRAASSRDGRNWTWGGVWTFPPDTTPRIGLVAHGGAQPAVAAEFDYFRVHRLAHPR